jgi:hypothetical protein
LKYFPRENILFIDGEDTLKRPHVVIEEAQKFMNIDPQLKEENFVINPESGFYCVNRPNPKYKGNLKGTLKSRMKCLPRYKGRTRGNGEHDEYLEISDVQKEKLDELFVLYNKQLCEIVGHSMGFYQHLC